MRLEMPRLTGVTRSALVQIFGVILVGIGLGVALKHVLGSATSAQASVMTLISAILLVVAGALIWSVVARMQALSETAEELQASQERLRELGHFRQEFLANMSHEFRTPLNAIQGFAQAIQHRQDEMSSAQIADYIAIIERSARDLGELTDNVLDLSKLDAQKFEFELSDIDLTRLVLDAVGQHSAKAAERDIKFNCDFEEDWIIRSDPRGIRRCIAALVSNALKFSNEGENVDVRAYRRGRRSFVIEISDTGSGIESEDLKNIWMVYARSSATKKTHRVGAGLGLAITRSLMDAHNGFIEIDSTVGQGTSVRLCFPNTMIVSPTYSLPGDAPQQAIAG